MKIRSPRPWVVLPLLLIVATFFTWQCRAALLSGAARLWVISDEPLDRADAIVVLGGDLETRPIAAAKLYQRGVASRIILSNPVPVTIRTAIPRYADLNRRVLIDYGVPSEAISTFGENLTSSFQEARALLQWAKDNHASAFVIPMDIFPTRRVRWIFDRELGPAGMHVAVLAVTPHRYSVENWWHDEAGLIAFQNEVVKYAYYRYEY